ncbi:MAG: hypothetical protein BM564_06130 [Bacteroidetes bacterium MedPE-SWsnd-G2]|nr:MAG: hypothetical protein BM564_06130 [Bacteroidetes bacterium MedPE-SWsnd-G2]
MLLKKIVILCLCIGTLLSCNSKKKDPDNIFKYKDYISYTSTGPLSIEDAIFVNLAAPINGWQPGQTIDGSFISSAPKFKFSVVTISNRGFKIVPETNLQPDQEYNISLSLNELYPNIPEGFKTYTFKTSTIAPNFNVVTNALQSYGQEWQYLEGAIKSADKINLEQAKQLVIASQENRSLNIEFDEGYETGTYFAFKVDSIQRKELDSEILISWDGSAIQSDNTGENTIQIPGKNNFTIIDVTAYQYPEQHVSINFSDPIQKQQNFDGLVSLENVKDIRYVVRGNVLKLYPDTNLMGDVILDVFTGIKNTSGYKLKSTFSQSVSFRAKKPSVRLVNSGSILPNSDHLNFNFEAVNLKAVDVRIIKIFEDNVLQFLQSNNINSDRQSAIRRVGRRVAKATIPLIKNTKENSGQWKAYGIDLSKYFTADPGAIYRVELSFNKHYSLYNCNASSTASNEDDFYEDEYYYDEEENYNSYLDSSEFDEDDTEEAYWDDRIYSYRNFTYNWQERENPCHDAYYNEDRIIAQNLVASNIGIIGKRTTNNTYHFAVNNILSTAPIGKANIKIYNFQQQEIGSTTTGNDGLAKIQTKKNAAFAIASFNNQVSYLRLTDGKALSLSKFDVSGKKLQKGLKGYIYGERGVWRPGDTLHLSFMLSDNANPLPEGHPVKLEISDPQGQLVYKTISTNGLNNFHRFNVPTSSEAKTGNWNAQVSVGGASFNKTLKIETIKPNRLKLKLDFDQELLSSEQPIAGELSSTWLHGAVAKNLKAEIKAKFSSTTEGFKNYPNYSFNDPTRDFSTEEFDVFEGKLNENGTTNFRKSISIGNQAPGLLKVQFLTRVFENGGDFSMDAFSKTYAPYKSFVGLKLPEADTYGSYATGDNHQLNIVVINAKGKPVKSDKLQLKVYKINWRWWWDSSRDNLSRYNSSAYHEPYISRTLSTDSNGKGSFKLNIPKHQRGRYLVRVINPNSGHATGATMYFYDNWWEQSPSSDKEAAKMLVFSSDKKKYNVGETAVINFPSSSEGNALISIENGTEILKQQWVKTTKGMSKVEIPITEEMTPNIFVNISLLQPHASVKNDLPVRLYGVIPLLVENPGTLIQPEITMPKSLKPEQEFEVSVSEKTGNAMTYTVAVVEEGLLDLTRFKTPNAWDTFYAREALGVKTWDLYDDVVGAYSGSIDQVFEVGGDGSAAAGKKKKANRFKPVVKYLGPFYLEDGKTNTHKIKLPNYIGSVRTMVVAGNTKTAAYGNAEETTVVKKPLMVLASLPRKLSPGEKVTLPVTVFAMEKSISKVKLSLNLSNGIKVIGDQNQLLSFDRPDEKMAYFDLDVSDSRGVGTIEVIATSNGETSKYKVELDVFNPNPFTSKTTDLVLDGTTTQSTVVTAFGETGSNTAILEFSTLPPIDFTRRLEYLIRYPHGCVEQTTSSVFPQLFMGDIFDLPSNKLNAINNNIKKGIARLSHFQLPDGSMSYWMGENRTSDWGTTYAGHFLIEAEKKGYVLPLTFKSNWIRYQQKEARNWKPTYNSYNSDLAQAYRLYTLALAGQPDLSAMNRLKEFEALSNEARWRLAAAYALAGQREASISLSQNANLNFGSNTYDYRTYGSTDRNRAMALETMVLTNNGNTRETAQYIANVLSGDRWLSTQSTAYSLLALSKMVTSNGGKSMAIKYTINGKSQTLNTTKSIAQRDLSLYENKLDLTIENQKDNTVYVRVLNSGKLPLGKEISSTKGLDVNVTYKTLSGEIIDVSKLQQGQDFVASISIKNLKNEAVKDVALTQIFPSGWEIINTRFSEFGEATANHARYIDIRDDRVNYYFDMSSGESKTFNTMLNASYLGQYYLPGVQAEAMYDNNYFVRGLGKWITINK